MMNNNFDVFSGRKAATGFESEESSSGDDEDL